jgi:predicted metallo-beta-lactamase superfamily hydrolase
MTTKPASEIKEFSDDEPIKKIYTAIDELKEFIPHGNERNRLGYTINLYFEGEISSLLKAIDQSKVLSTIEYTELEKLLRKKLQEKGLTIKDEN